tara:strand:+ start:620 stop:811 length:192 start_codon:yes stop_codon:yes gene_type:complete
MQEKKHHLCILPLKRAIGRYQLYKNKNHNFPSITQEFTIEQKFVDLLVSIENLKKEYITLKNL